MRVCLENGRARSDHFAPLAPRIARSADLLQPAVGGRQIRRGWQSSLSGGLPCAIDVEDQGVGSLPIPQPTWFLLLFQRSGHQVFQEERAQRLDRSLVEAGEKAGERRARRQSIPSEQSHEGAGKWLHALIERFQGAFRACRIAQQHSDKVYHLIVTEAATRKAHLLFYGGQHPLVFQEVRDHGHFPEPAGR